MFLSHYMPDVLPSFYLLVLLFGGLGALYSFYLQCLEYQVKSKEPRTVPEYDAPLCYLLCGETPCFAGECAARMEVIRKEEKAKRKAEREMRKLQKEIEEGNVKEENNDENDVKSVRFEDENGEAEKSAEGGGTSAAAVIFGLLLALYLLYRSR